MPISVSFNIPGTPVAKARARVVIKGGRAYAYTPRKTQEHQDYLALMLREARVLKGPIALEVSFIFGKNPRTELTLREVDDGYTNRPDLDNLLKLMDALPFDDKRVVSVIARKIKEV